jgi:antitoxin HigA-1
LLGLVAAGMLGAREEVHAKRDIGRTLAAELAARGLTANALAPKLRVPANRVSEIVRGHCGISPETALRLGRYFGTSAQSRMNLQANYDLAIARQELGATVEREVEAA